jgi:hypothetical protein
MSRFSPLRYPRQCRDMYSYWKAFRRFEEQPVEVCIANNPEHQKAAKRLHALVYLRRGFVDIQDISNGHIGTRSDPHQKHAVYFVAMDKKHHMVLATARQIHAQRIDGHRSFPMIVQANLYEKTRRWIEAHEPKACVEISALAKHQAADSVTPLLLYRAMWHQSIREHHKVWLMACDVRLYGRLKILFGPAIRKAGKVTAYYGGRVVPAVLDVQGSIRAAEKGLRRSRLLKRVVRKHVVRFFLQGLPVDKLSVAERRAYERLKREI